MSTDPQMLKGVLSLLLLTLLTDDESYGYAVVVALRAKGFEDLAEGSVYPALSRLEGQGLLTSTLRASASGPARKYYRTTPAGRAELDRARQAWADLVGAVDRVVCVEGSRA